MKALVTGSSGFVGRFVVECLQASRWETVAAVRMPTPGCVYVGDIHAFTDWSSALEGCEAVVHLAGRVHVVNDRAKDPISEYRRVNVEGTERLLSQAVEAGVKRFLFMSTLKVLGEENDLPYTENDPPSPQDPYAVSKWEAEQRVQDICAKSGMEYVILRPPLVYGPGVRANFRRLTAVVEGSRIPLPFGLVRNKRSIVYVGNLADLVRHCLVEPAAANNTYVLDDGEPVSLPTLISMMASSLGRSPRLFPVPSKLMALAARMAGRDADWRRLAGSLYVDTRKLRDQLGWSPPLRMKEAMFLTMHAYLNQTNNEPWPF